MQLIDILALFHFSNAFIIGFGQKATCLKGTHDYLKLPQHLKTQMVKWRRSVTLTINAIREKHSPLGTLLGS